MIRVDASQMMNSTKSVSKFKKRIKALLPLFSLAVCLVVFWWLKLTGITLAGDAFCGMTEHVHEAKCETKILSCSEKHNHNDECYEITYTCGYEEHIHVALCYSNINADLETPGDWEASLKNVSIVGSSKFNVTNVAYSQLGYEESEMNFIIDPEGNRRGYTRYGEWYGNPYGNWATMFTSFCLRYADFSSVPISAGAETMRLAWEEKELYILPEKYYPISGDIVFLDKNKNGSADSTAVVFEVGPDVLAVIEGDVENSVAIVQYNLSDGVIMGYGLVPGAGYASYASIMLAAEGDSDQFVIAKTTNYDKNLFVSTNSFVVYTVSGSNYYAFDGNGNAVQINIDSSGNITADVDDPSILLWTFSASGGTNSYLIRNISSGRYMHAYPSNGGGVVTGGAYTSTLIQSGSGVKVKSNNEFAYLDTGSKTFKVTTSQNSAATYYFGVTSNCTVWLDGTNGNLMSLGGSLNRGYTVSKGNVIKLPSEWQSPAKYEYKLRGWYDIINSKYYPVGTEITVTENMVFFADWQAVTYDIGQFNASVVDTVSTNEFITTKVFDYSYLFNVMSSKANVTVDASGHSETWSLVTSGNVPYNNRPTLDFIFRDWDRHGSSITYPNNTNSKNTNGGVHSGLYTDEIGRLFFADNDSYDPQKGTGIIGKQYLGTADYLFQFMTDPSNEHYGYYYYDSTLNAASYNQSNNRFYVYDYLERTTDSAKGSDDKKYSDFLPLNSPYVNTNGKDIAVYSYDGVNGEYAGKYHYMYDAKYNSEGSSENAVATNFLFGMSMDIDFFLPDVPGSNGGEGNKDLYGKDMHFKFSGDDDVWVLVDGKLVLDIGGIHGVESGDINFSTGVVTVNGTQTGTITNLAEGEHTLTLYYLERGSSQSNCAIYFNLAPRFSFSIQKEDVLTQDVLNGAEFSVFTDVDCTIPAVLWESEASYNNDEPSTNKFIVKNGVANMWGMSAGKTYYIKETAPPYNEDYGISHGIICLSLDKRGIASYSVEITGEKDDNGNFFDPSNGFTVHGFKIDEETQKAYIIATNAPKWVVETTTVQALKKWGDTLDHSDDSVTVYLTVTDPDGTVRRIREIALSDENDWTYTWTSLPKFYEDGITKVQYGVEEAYKSGYYSKVEKIDEISISDETWAESYTFENGKTYILRTSNGFLSTKSASDGNFKFVDEATAKKSPLALWKATVSGTQVKLTNQQGQILTFYSNGNSSYFYSTTNSVNYQTLRFSNSNNGVSMYYTSGWTSYYMYTLNSNGTISNTRRSQNAMIFSPITKISEEIIVPVEDEAFQITNMPLDTETSLTVKKEWETENGSSDLYQEAQVTIKLYANGKDTGRTLTLSLKNGWSDTFLGLPYKDTDGNVISYTVVESWNTEDWIPSYGEIITVGNGATPKYETTVTNTYRWDRGVELPATGGIGSGIFYISGASLMLLALALGLIIKSKKTKEQKRKM